MQLQVYTTMLGPMLSLIYPKQSNQSLGFFDLSLFIDTVSFPFIYEALYIYASHVWAYILDLSVGQRKLTIKFQSTVGKQTCVIPQGINAHSDKTISRIRQAIEYRQQVSP